jgi:methylase of polypeptide subunit release factors
LAESSSFLKSGGHLLIEIGFSQAVAVRALIDQRVWRLQDIRPDLQGIPRIVVLQKLLAD